MDLYDADLFASYMEEHIDYHALKNEYSGKEILKEAILFMNSAFPEWNTNAGIGTWAAEFIYDCISEIQVYDDEGARYSTFEILKNLYESLAYDYENRKADYSFHHYRIMIKKFNEHIDIEEFDYENEHLSVENYMALYNMKLADFEEEYKQKITYDFIDIL